LSYWSLLRTYSFVMAKFDPVNCLVQPVNLVLSTNSSGTDLQHFDDVL